MTAPHRRLDLLRILYTLLFPIVAYLPLHPIPAGAVDPPAALFVAAASNLRFPMDEAIALYEKVRAVKVTVTYGASGSLSAQILAGAPYDLFFSADESIPKKLIEADAGLAESYFIYGRAQIVLWVLNDSPIDLDQKGMDALLHPAINKIAVANPRHAPYGMAAIETLRKIGFLNRLQKRLVYGENVSQAAEYVRKGGAEMGIISYSLALSKPLQNVGRYWHIPSDLYPMLNQAGLILKRSPKVAEAESFVLFLTKGAGREILQKYGLLNGRDS